MDTTIRSDIGLKAIFTIALDRLYDGTDHTQVIDNVRAALLTYENEGRKA